MIPGQWYAIMDSKEVPKGRPVGVTRMGEKLVFYRDTKGQVCCLSDICCHRGAALHCGHLDGDRLACPFHGFQYDATGKVVLIPANGKNAPVPDRYHVRSYTVRELGGFIWLWWGEQHSELPPVPMFEGLLDGFTYSTFSDPWPVHYSRCIENQLDVMHLPFVHTSTIGRGNKTLVHGPAVVWDAATMTFYVKNVVDDGQTIPQKPEEIKDLESLFHLKFRMPNIWQNFIADKIRIFAAFAPVDEHNSVVYVRFYQAFMKVPGLRHFINFIGGKVTNRIILHQDRRVVVTQLPDKSQLQMDEKLAQGDRPIIEYRRRRDELQKAGKGQG